MSSESATKRQKRGPSPSEAPDRSVADMEALFDQKLLQMEQKMQSKIDSLQSEVDAMKDRLSRVDEMEKKCKHLEEKCASMGRSLTVLAGRWEFTPPDIPASHWTDQGFDDAYITTLVGSFVDDIQTSVSELKRGVLDMPCFGADDDQLLRHDDALLPYWQHLADSLDLYGHLAEIRGDTLSLEGTQLHPKVLQILTPSLRALSGISEINLNMNGFEHSLDGIQFVGELARSNPDLSTLNWAKNAFDSEEDVNAFVEVVRDHPSIRTLRLENCCEDDIDGYRVLRLLLSGTSGLQSIDLAVNDIHTLGDTWLSDYLATNPPLQKLLLDHNSLDNNDALVIAEALKHNTNLRELRLDDNEITEVGHNALRNAVFDRTSLNSAASSNHTCRIYRLSSWNHNQDQRVNRRSKIYGLLSARNEEETNVHHLNMELDDDSLKLVPRVLKSVYSYAEDRRSFVDDSLQRAMHPLSIYYELLRGWKMPFIYENSRMQMPGE